MMTTVSTFRLYLLRAGYLLLVLGLGSQMWPAITSHVTSMDLMHGVVTCMLWSMSVLAVLGIRYPLQMLPLIFFEITWKAAWLLTVVLPKWSAGGMDAGTAETAFECSFVVIFLVVVPWRYVFERYVKRAGDPWRGGVARAPLPNLEAR